MTNEEPRRTQLLLVDDESQTREALATILEFFGLEVTTAASGKAALALYRRGRFNYVVLDYRMRKLRGDVLAGEIKAMHPRQKVVMVTGYPEAVLQEGQLPKTIDCLVEKPCTIEDLMNALNSERSRGENRCPA